MRTLPRLLWGLLAAVVIVVLAIYAAQNLQPVTTNFLAFRFTPDVWWVVLGSAALGFALALLALGPGRIAAGWRARGLRHTIERAQSDLATLHERHAALQAERDTLQAERDHLRSRVEPRAPLQTPVQTTVQQPVVGRTPQGDVPVSASSTMPTAAPAPAGEDRIVSSPAGTMPAQPMITQPTMSERLRGMMHRPGVNEPPQNPPTDVTDQGQVPPA